MKQCTETITVFNAALDQETGCDIYTPTVIRGVSWYSHVVSSVTKDGLVAANQFVIRIPVDADFSGKIYRVPADYARAQDRSGMFTFSHGDVIIHAEVSGSMTPTQLQAQYGEIVTVLGVTDNRRAPKARHWKITGK